MRRNSNDRFKELYEVVKKRNANDTEFLQAVEEVFESLNVIAQVHPEKLDDDVLTRIVEPEDRFYSVLHG